MKVSVIIPTYNRAKYICQAIESVLQQTVDDIEIIVIDDGSTDNTKEVIKPYMEKIRYVYAENGGAAHARNKGMEIARGEYISFLDSDDLYYAYKTELQTSFMDRFPDIGMVYSEFTAFGDDGFLKEYHIKEYHSPAYSKKHFTYENIFTESLTFMEAGLDIDGGLDRKIYMGNIFETYLNNVFVFTNSIMFRRDSLEAVGMLDERYRLYDLSDFVLRLCRNCRVAFIDIPTYKLRYHIDQISDTSHKEGINTVIQKQYELLKIGEQHGLSDKKYYSEHRDQVNKRLAVLHKALALPLIGKGKDPISARMHLEKCAHYGHPEVLLRLITFPPYIIRRIMLKIISILKI